MFFLTDFKTDRLEKFMDNKEIMLEKSLFNQKDIKMPHLQDLELRCIPDVYLMSLHVFLDVRFLCKGTTE